ncbi:site-specific integrase [bacterium]|nr:MAG: site-specific integrase [bacterium]
MKAFRKELAAGTATLEKDITMSELFDRLMAEVYAPKLRSSTLVQYEGLVKNHLRPLRDVRLSRLTVTVIDPILRDTSKGRRTREMVRRFLITSLNHAVRIGLAKENVAKRTLPVGGEAKLVGGLSAAEVRAILAHAPNPLVKTAFRTQVELGLRVGELLGLHRGDLNPAEKTVMIRQQIQRDRRSKKLVLGPLKTAKSRRTLPVSDSLLNEITEVMTESEFIFPSETGGPLEPRNYNRALTQAAKKAGVGHVSSHRLRHSYASWALGLGVDIAIISRALGHTQISTTMRYAAATPEVIRQGNDLLSAMLDDRSL